MRHIRGAGVLVVLALIAGCSSHPAARAGDNSQPAASSTVTTSATEPAETTSATEPPVTTSATEPPDPLAACEAALGPNVATASATTIGDLRAYNYGPAQVPTGTEPATGIQPGKNGFPGDAPGDFGAWCATGHAGDWVTWGVDAHGQSLRMVEIEGAITAPPTGGPEIP